MTWGEVAQLATAAAAIGSLIASLRNAGKIEVVRHATNSMKDELVALTAKSAKAEGVLEGTEKEKERQAGA